MGHTKYDIDVYHSFYCYINDWHNNVKSMYDAPENIVKLGVTQNIRNRQSTYNTPEPNVGKMVFVAKVPATELHTLDIEAKIRFKRFRYKRPGAGGKELYYASVIPHIMQYLIDSGYTMMTQEEIDGVNRCLYLNAIAEKIDALTELKDLLPLNEVLTKYRTRRNKHLTDETLSMLLTPLLHQQMVLDTIKDFYATNKVGKLIWACGLGKARQGIYITKALDAKTVLIGVPNNNLQFQMKNEIKTVYPTAPILFVGGDNAAQKNVITAFMTAPPASANVPKFVITTYHSCYLLVDKVFDLKIGDEAHHLVGLEPESDRGFRLFHKIPATHTLFMTATEKVLADAVGDKTVYSMDDEAIFGKYIDIKTVKWAIDNKKITDYLILLLKNTEDDVDNILSALRIDVKNKELFISVYMCLKAIERYPDLTHVLLYTNCAANARKAQIYIRDILGLNILGIKPDQLYNKALCTSAKNNFVMKDEIDAFCNAKYGIISCVYMFGEGFDLPKLNGVCVACDMQSDIRIVQYLLRANRLDCANPGKKAYILLPYIDKDDEWVSTGRAKGAFERIRTIIAKMRNVDERIEYKIAFKGSNPKIEPDDDAIETIYTVDTRYGGFYGNDGMVENDDAWNELERIKMRLRYSKALGSKCSEEEDEYNYVRSFNIELKIRSVAGYHNSSSVHSNFIANPEDYFKAKGVWKGWLHFIGVDTSKFMQTKFQWVTFCKQKKIRTLEEYNTACEKYEELPADPGEFYGHFTNVLLELNNGRNITPRMTR